MKARRTQLRLWLLALDRFEKALLRRIAYQRASFIREASKKYDALGEVPAWVVGDHKNAIRSILEAHYKVVIPYFGGMMIKQIKSIQITRKAAHRTFTALMEEWVTTEGLRKAISISSTDYDDVVNAIQSGIAEGEGTATIARRIRDKAALTPFRAATVARTETHNAATFGSIETAREMEKEFGVAILKAWAPTMDDRTRPEHRDMQNRDAIPIDQKFEVGGEQMDRPGDAAASPANVINCRCALVYEEKE